MRILPWQRHWMGALSIVEKIESLFQRLAPLHDFYLRDLRSGQEWEFGTKRAYPIGSCFKLALLMAVFETVDAEEMDSIVEIPTARVVAANGLMHMVDSPLHFSFHQLCQLTLTASDATVTDLLIERVGLEQVNTALLRHASASHLACNLAEMVAEFRAVPEAAGCKQRGWDEVGLAAFTDQVAAFGSTNARDLAELALSTWNYEPPPALANHYQRCIHQHQRSMPRTQMFYAPPVAAFTKTGSLGYRFFLNDCGVILDAGSLTPLAVLGYCSAGWQLAQWHADTVCGEIGLSILDLLGIDRPFHPDWSAVSSRMIRSET